MARRTRGRKVDGILLVDKPTGKTSNAVLQQVKRIYFAQKAGHTGALDPLATGMLPICLGDATKFSQYLLESDKRYQVCAKLGQRTTTSDADGEVVETREVNVTIAQIEQALERFKGVIEQVPSIYSALKYQGKPLYWYAREGIDVPRKSRPITVYSIDIINFEDDLLKLDIHCSKGTYIRTIVDDLGELLGCGAHVAQLHRSHVGDYPSDQVISLQRLEALLEQATEQEIVPAELLDPLLLKMDSAVSCLPTIDVSEELGLLLMQGRAVELDNVAKGALLRLYVGDERRFIGIGMVNEDGLLAPKRLIALDA
ncbi:tRNA pseudouridine(55) synthase TruB [Celerinatantimonas diazotrophica]|uniref:tRNA pseudouridine synthase B n=1 Tax=Celerinatantimonas diazotrophica TaxID=412034 RepID=A0A4R1K4K2_9GAMM|nr:tRNA pseudouridine(55) synthase TruB [Celerinatantimonas diazotrophica]TCK58860.1 tRNA pseudouridine synthase B [Celerinatantimonas diazotrophica]CAG9297492.1 tRNA pseudouridine synthase B [Celerinatantimonas diazotrophica]